MVVFGSSTASLFELSAGSALATRTRRFAPAPGRRAEFPSLASWVAAHASRSPAHLSLPSPAPLRLRKSVRRPCVVSASRLRACLSGPCSRALHSSEAVAIPRGPEHLVRRAPPRRSLRTSLTPVCIVSVFCSSLRESARGCMPLKPLSCDAPVCLQSRRAVSIGAHLRCG
jgi:hypothetical protein